ncbi:MAG: UDP-N-acetylglucosamine 1-carboxyvinyltransferase [Firmicutes bacterium]|nr:UDP-N-acetylglucosamine 1-carboxyvinyltransferase [Bacillota bacterium]
MADDGGFVLAKFIVENSGPLVGEVEVSGAKNAVLPILAATLLTGDKCEIYDVPRLRDVDVMCSILRAMGAKVTENWDEHTICVEASEITSSEVPYELVKKMRASFFVMGPLLGRTGKTTITMPGGCSIGNRPIDLHLKGLKKLGTRIMMDQNGSIDGIADHLSGSLIYLDFPSVGATENIMMAAAVAEGQTVIENAAEEPEIVDLASFLNKMGADIKGAGTDTIRIKGVKELHGAKHAVIPDRIETGTFMVAAAITRGDVLIKNSIPGHVMPVIAKLMECGAAVNDEVDGIRVRGDLTDLVATNIKTLPYPGFPTDMQAQFMAFLTTVEGESSVMETVFENRFMHVAELNRMGANIRVEDRKAFVPGNKRPLVGAQVVTTDLRAGAALVLAGLYAKGRTEVSEIYHIERGYENFVEKFTALGAKIIRVDEE